jgi:hypothetical protein
MSGIPENLMTYELHEDEDLEWLTDEGILTLKTRGEDLFIDTNAYHFHVKHFYFGPQRRCYLSTDDVDAIEGINTRTTLSDILENLIDALEDKLLVEWFDIEPLDEWIRKRLTQKPFV